MPELQARAVLAHFRAVGGWVNWGDTVDQFLYGDPEREVRGIACAWIATNRAIREAGEKGLNLFISHEPIFYRAYEESPSGKELADKKRVLLDRLGITVLRCHDTWDRMPDCGIPDAWAAWLGFPTEPRPVESFYKTCLLGDITVEEAGRRVLEKVRPLGQDTVLILGDRTRRVRRMAVGTGAITNLTKMLDLRPDLMLATDDGINMWTAGHWAVDLGMPLLIVNHATAEKPGMMAMPAYLRQVFPGLPAEYVDCEFPYSSL